MIEPLAAAIVNGVLPRTSARRTSVLKSAAILMGNHARKPFPEDFFTPHPRSWKGKERAQDPVTFECSACTGPFAGPNSGICCATRHSLWCPKRTRVFTRNEITPRRLPGTGSGTVPRSTRRHSSSSAPQKHTLQSHMLETVSSQSQAHHDPVTTNLSGTMDIRSLLHPSVPFDPNTAWALYSESVKDDVYDPFTPDERLLFMEKLVNAVEPELYEQTSISALHKWGLRLHSMMHGRDVCVANILSEDFRKLCLSARIYALMGDLTGAVQIAREGWKRHLTEAEQGKLVDVYRTLLIMAHLREGSTATLNLVVEEWNVLGPYVGSYHNAFVGTSFETKSESLRHTVRKIIAEVTNGAALLSSRWKHGEQDLMRTAELLLLSYIPEGSLEEAHAVMVEMRSLRLSLPISHQTALIRRLAKANSFVLANEVFSFISPSNYKPYLSVGLYLYARQGNITRAEEFFNNLRKQDCLSPTDKAMLMHAYAVSARVETVIDLFNEFFPEDGEEKPTIFHYTTVVLAFAQRGDFEGLNFWLKAMMEAGHPPDAHVYSIILESFASRGDVDTVAVILDQMRVANIQPSRVHYTTVIKFLAQRRDPASAEAIYKRALQEGIVPDRIMITALMNAHVEAGSWPGVIRIFDFLKGSGHRKIPLTIEVYNTLLKAYVMIGTPFHTVSMLFRRLQSTAARPDAYTYALVIQSACDAGLMNVASDLFAEMEDRVGKWEPRRGIEVYVLTIIMAGHLRLGHKSQAKAVYDDMIARGIQPTSITFSQILQAYGNQGTEDSLRIAEAFLRGIVESDPQRQVWATPKSLQSALEELYSPLMTVYSKQRDPKAVERLFEAMLEAGGEPTLLSLTILLDVYRRTDNITAIRKVWEQIWELALRLSRVDELFKGEDNAPTNPLSRQSNLLCLPLSIYIDALSAAGHHSAVPEIWLKVRSQGFSFDSHNWNHLAVALVRAAELDRAFAVVERVILPYQCQSLIVASTRDRFPESPLTFDAAPPDVDSPVPESPLHRQKRRVAAVKLVTKRSRHNLDIDGDPDDFAHPLHILHQILPSWNVWRPHHIILELLASVLRHLQGGRVVQPVGVSQQSAGSDNVVSRAKMASDTLQRIYDEYPSTVRAVLLHERALSRRNAIKRADDGWS
ncbi:hypothetical protein BKA82DRAFT_4109040 [Pisolithus tinctorius]|nr:hypothetical protein BKA82DRAFT_4109040 [Pisolithus tinctorius]